MRQSNKKVITLMLTGVALMVGQVHMKAQSDLKNKTELNKNEEVMNSELRLKVKGMHCQSGCASGIDAMLKEQQGIIKSETSFDKSSAIIEFDPILISEEEIIKLITDRGFEVEVVTEKGEDIPQQ